MLAPSAAHKIMVLHVSNTQHSLLPVQLVMCFETEELPLAANLFLENLLAILAPC